MARDKIQGEEIYDDSDLRFGNQLKPTRENHEEDIYEYDNEKVNVKKEEDIYDYDNDHVDKESVACPTEKAKPKVRYQVFNFR